MLSRSACLTVVGLLLVMGAASAQTDSVAGPRRIAAEGVLRASAQVDSVFIDRLLPTTTVDGGDFAAYLMARLGARNLPPDFAFTVEIDTSLIRIGGRIADLPPEGRQALSQLILLLPPETRLEAQVELARAGTEAVRFHLAAVTVEGVAIPEPFLAALMANVGSQFPALTATGRDLYVRVPAGATIALKPGAVTLNGP